MQNGDHITVLHMYLISIAVFKMEYRMADTYFRKKKSTMLHESDFLKSLSCFCFQILYHTNTTLKILTRGDLSSTDTLLNILKWNSRWQPFLFQNLLLPYHFILKLSNEFPLTK